MHKLAGWSRMAVKTCVTALCILAVIISAAVVGMTAEKGDCPPWFKWVTPVNPTIVPVSQQWTTTQCVIRRIRHPLSGRLHVCSTTLTFPMWWLHGVHCSFPKA